MQYSYDKNDPLVRKAVEIIIKNGNFSTSMLQTYLGKGHGYVSSLAIWFEQLGIIDVADGNKPRKVLISSMKEFDQATNENRHISIVNAKSDRNTGKYIPSSLSSSLRTHSSDYNFLAWKVFSIILAPFSLGLSLFWTKYLFETEKELLEYYNSKEFDNIKKEIRKNANDVNELNQHIIDLKNTYVGESIIPHGESTLTSGGYNFKRTGWSDLNGAPNVHHCSLLVVKNSKEDPFRYICKYFDINPNEDNLNKFETLYNNFAAAEQGQALLLKERDELFSKISERIPEKVIKYTPYMLVKELGFNPVNTTPIHYPSYSFSYVSAGGNSMARNDIIMDLHNIEEFNEYLAAKIKWRKSIAGQRALMTSRLREFIKERDHYTCRKCGASTKKEPNLLLEIDHIKPLAKGGETTEENLQTLCWRCNRKKGARLE